MDTVDRLYDLDPSNDLPENFFIIMYGLRRSGKTTMLRYMLWEMQARLQEYEIYLFSGTAEVSPEDYEYIPKKAKFPNVKVSCNDVRPCNDVRVTMSVGT